MTRWEGANNIRCGMGHCANGVMFDVVEWVKRNILRWFGYLERMKCEEFVKRVYVNGFEGSQRRGRPVVRWKGYMPIKGANRKVGIKHTKLN